MKMKTIKLFGLTVMTCVMTCGITALAHATTEGFYLGAQAGQSNVHSSTKDVQTQTTPSTVSTSPNNTGFGGRLFIGANLNRYAAIEGGYTHYAASTYKPSVSALCGNPQIKENALDLVGKARLPFGSGFEAFGKGGLAYVMTSQSGSLQPISNPVTSCGSSQSNNGVRPTAAVGVSYDISPSWVADVSFSRVFGNSSIQTADLIALGISYHFVDKYCGQFLC